VILTRPDARITADSSLYKQRTNEVEFTGNVKVTYKDLKAWSKTAKYDIDGDIATLIGEAGALRGDNALAGREIRIFFKEDRVTVKGGTRIKINREELK
jgi:lipopolysaccharide export system protein LptA